MSTSTQILFNSPALHSLKRDQLIKLCKLHNIKASGKNTELIEKLKKHAETLPRDAPLSVAARSEFPAEINGGDEGDETMHDDTEKEQSHSTNACWGFQMLRPSEQWDVVMEDIKEVDEKSSQGTLNSLRTVKSDNGGFGEFGTGMSKSPSASSSLASSFGLKRGNASKATASSTSLPLSSSFKSPLHLSTPGSDILAQTTTPYSSLRDTSAPQTDISTFDPMPGNPVSPADSFVPLPGHTLRPGVQAPADARLSFGLNERSTPTREPTTTIRLISSPVSDDNSYGRTPWLHPFKTSFDLDFGSPQPSGGFHGVSLWPSSEGQQKKGLYPPLPLDELVYVDTSIPGFLASRKPAAPSLLSPTLKSTTTTRLAVTDPFIFGSPLPQHNVSNSQFKSAATSVLEEMNKRLKQDGVNGIGMDVIARLQPGAHAVGVGTLAPREGKEAYKTNIYKEKFDKLHEEDFSKMEGIDSLVRRRGLLAPKGRAGPGLVVKRKSSASGAAGHGVGRDRFGRRIGGGSGRLSATTIVNESRERRRLRIVPGTFGDEDEEEVEAGPGDAKPSEPAKEEDKKKRVETKEGEDEGKIKAEEQKQKEREAIKKKLEMNKARRKSSVACAQGRVSVGRGGVVLKPQPKPSRFGFLSSAKSLVAKVWSGGKAVTASGAPKPATTKGPKAAPAAVPVPAPTVPKKVQTPARSLTATNPTAGRVLSLRDEKDKAATSMSSTASSLRSRTLGTRSSLVSTGRSSSSGTVMSSNKMLAGSGSHSSNGASAAATGKPSSSRLPSTRLSSSRLLAPTASSLAKAAANKPSVSGSKSSLKNAAEGSSAQVRKSQSSGSETLSMITNSPRMPVEPWSPRPKRIFSKLLVVPSRIPTPTKKPQTTSMENGVAEKEDVKETFGLAPNKQRSLNRRKPRISRSKVIAKLASQRAASASRPGLTSGVKAGRTRSSLGVKAQRSSYSGKPISAKGSEESVLMSAKKRVRQSEYARRKSHVASIDLGKEVHAMEVDAE